MSDHEEKLTAETKAYIDKMKASLRELGVNLANGVDIQEQARVISNRIAANEAAAQHDLDCAARERDTAQTRIKELDDELLKVRATKCLDAVDVSAGIVEPANDYTAEVHAARIAALKTLGVNPYDPPVCIHGAAKKKAKTLEHAQKFEDELAQIWELWGAGRPMTPGCVLDAAQEHKRLNTALHTKLGAIAEMLDGAIMPKNYGRNETGGPIPLTDRVAILIASEAEEKRMVKRWREAAMNEGEEITDARCVLDELGAPAHAGEIALTIAARIRALPGLLRKD